MTDMGVSIEQRLRFLGIDRTTRDTLVAFRPLIEQELPGVLDRFYGHIKQWPELHRRFGGDAHIAHVKQAQLRHWLRIAEGTFDADYVASVRRIGEAHNKQKLEPNWYIGGYAHIAAELMQAAVRAKLSGHWLNAGKLADLSALQTAMMKAVLLDMDIAISVYLEAGRKDKTREIGLLADTFEGSLSGVIHGVTESATRLDGNAQALAAAAEQSTRQAAAIAAAAEQAAANVQTVAAATEELTASITEIGQQVSQSSRIASLALETAQKTDNTVRGLVEAAQKIGEVVTLINDIAGQTNLLALNATIEAARAGDAGKGFAVVASEVKTLANQTAKATEGISAQVADIQSVSENAARAIGEIGRVIGRMNEIASAIAAAVEQQGAATGEIARNIAQAASGTQEVSANIAGLTESARSTGGAAEDLLAASRGLGRQASTLNQESQGFVATLKKSA